jgi:hypothetical protein
VELIRTQDIRLDVLVNNAGVLVDPRRHPPEQGVSFASRWRSTPTGLFASFNVSSP